MKKCPRCGGHAVALWQRDKEGGPVNQVGPYECQDCDWIEAEDDEAPLTFLDDVEDEEDDDGE